MVEDNHHITKGMNAFYATLTQIHRQLNEDMVLGVGNLIRSGCEWMLKYPLMKSGVPIEKLDRSPPHRLLQLAEPIVRQKDILTLFRFVFRQSNILSHNKIGTHPSVTVDRLFHILILLYLWFSQNMLGHYRPVLERIEQMFSSGKKSHSKSEPQHKDTYDYRKLKDIPYDEDLDYLLSNEKVAIHHSALAYMNDLEEWKKTLIQAAVLLLSIDIDVPFLVKVHKENQIPITSINMENIFTIIAINIKNVSVILYMGPSISVEQWQQVNTIITNKKNYIEIIDSYYNTSSATFDIFDSLDTMLHEENIINSLQKVLYTQKSLAVETVQYVDKEISEEKHRKYQEICSTDTGFVQSNIALLHDDNELKQALQYPLSTWRLFLHPLQKNVVHSDKQFSMVYGGPGTGKTVVLIHRIKKKVEERKKLFNSSKKLPRFQVLLFTFTKQLAKNNSYMIKELDPLLRNYVYLKDIEELLFLVRTKRLVFYQKQKFLMMDVKDPKGAQTYWVPDIFIDEFQDFPSKNNSFITQLVKKIISTSSTLTCAYDTAQRIYHSDFQLKFWQELIPVDRFELNYCYRLTQKISQIARRHREILLEYAGSILRIEPVLSNEVKEPTHEQLKHAFSGGTFSLVPSYPSQRDKNKAPEDEYSKDYAQLSRITTYMYKLLENYSSDEIAVIYFDDDLASIQRLRIEKEIKKIESSFKVTFYNPRAVKGLEFKAGIILFGEAPFKDYQIYLGEGAKYGEVERLCRVINEFIVERILSNLESKSTLVPAFKSFFHFANLLLIYQRGDAKSKISTDNELYIKLKEHKLNLNNKYEIMHIYLNLLRSKDSQFLLNLHKLAVYLKEKPTELLQMKNNLQYITDINEKIKELTVQRRKTMFKKDINRALLDMNQFYVAITRFRESVYLIYNRDYRLDKLLPNADDG